MRILSNRIYLMTLQTLSCRLIAAVREVLGSNPCDLPKYLKHTCKSSSKMFTPLSIFMKVTHGNRFLLYRRWRRRQENIIRRLNCLRPFTCAWNCRQDTLLYLFFLYDYLDGTQFKKSTRTTSGRQIDHVIYIWQLSFPNFLNFFQDIGHMVSVIWV